MTIIRRKICQNNWNGHHLKLTDIGWIIFIYLKETWEVEISWTQTEEAHVQTKSYMILESNREKNPLCLDLKGFLKRQ